MVGPRLLARDVGSQVPAQAPGGRSGGIQLRYLQPTGAITELGISPELFVKTEVPDDYDTIGVGIDLSAGMSKENDWTMFTLADDQGGRQVYVH